MRSLLILSVFLAETALAWTGTATFKAKGTLPGMSIDGTGIVVEGEFPGKMTADLTKIKTGLELRDKHTQEHLETDKYPKATMVVTPDQGYPGQFTGVLELHGVQKEIKGTAESDGNKLKAQFEVNIADFGIKKPRHLGVGIDDVIKVSVEMVK